MLKKTTIRRFQRNSVEVEFEVEISKNILSLGQVKLIPSLAGLSVMTHAECGVFILFFMIKNGQAASFLSDILP